MAQDDPGPKSDTAYSHTRPWKHAYLAFRPPFMIAKDLVPISGIRSFAIMETFVVALIFAIFERARNRSQFIENRLRDVPPHPRNRSIA